MYKTYVVAKQPSLANLQLHVKYTGIISFKTLKLRALAGCCQLCQLPSLSDSMGICLKIPHTDIAHCKYAHRESKCKHPWVESIATERPFCVSSMLIPGRYTWRKALIVTETCSIHKHFKSIRETVNATMATTHYRNPNDKLPLVSDQHVANVSVTQVLSAGHSS